METMYSQQQSITEKKQKQ